MTLHVSRNFKAFTLIELLVVVAIIGILAAVGVVAYNGYTYGARVNVAKQNYKLISTVIKSEIIKCDLGEDKVLGFIDCNLTPLQRMHALTKQSNKTKVHNFFSGMKNPWCGNLHQCFNNDLNPIINDAGTAYTSPGWIQFASNVSPVGIYINSVVAYYEDGTSKPLSCNRNPNDKGCFSEFINFE